MTDVHVNNVLVTGQIELLFSDILTNQPLPY
jgi:hypothetical protein